MKKMLVGLGAVGLGLLLMSGGNSPSRAAYGDLAVTDSASTPSQGVGAVLLTGVAGVPGRTFFAICTVAGTVTLTFNDGSTLAAFPLAVGFNTLKAAVTKFASSTATCSVYGNLK